MTAHDAWLTLLCGFGVLVALGSTSGVVNDRLWVSEPLACAIAGIAMGPVGLGLLRLDPGSSPLAAHILREAARVTLVIAVSGAAMRLPADWLRRNWAGLSVALGPGMLLMWGAGALVAWGALGLSALPCLLIGAAIAPTDPVLSAPILSGRLAERVVPDQLRHAMTAESGINDGLGLPFVLLPILLISESPGPAIADWIVHVLFWQIGGACLVGALAGWLTSLGMAWARGREDADRVSLLTVTIALALATMAGVKLLGGDEILAAFVAGAVLNNSYRKAKVEAFHERFGEALSRFFDLPVMMLFGAVIPWAAWGRMGWSALAFAAGVLVLRRLPAWLLLGRLMPWTREMRSVLYAGWFGPIGTAALFYAMLIGDATGSMALWPAISLAVGASVLAHGVTATPLTRRFGSEQAGKTDDRSDLVGQADATATPKPCYASQRTIRLGHVNAHFRKLLSTLADTFWLLPGALVLLGIISALGCVALDRSGVVPQWLIDSPWLYNGGAPGARTLLGAVASSTIGVAGTVFSITIAALSLAAGQMGPRLLRNFTHDRGNQITLGTFLATFSYALMVLRSVRTESEGLFIPHLSLSIGILLAFVCVGMLVFFVGHMAGRINVDTVIELVNNEVRAAIQRLMFAEAQPEPPPTSFWSGATIVAADQHRGYLQQLDEESLADWGAEHGTSILLFARPGDYVFPGAPIAAMTKPVEGLEQAIRSATALGGDRATSSDLEFAIRQLVEVAVRALSPGINDPHTAMSVLDRLGAALCDAVNLHLATGVSLRGGAYALVRPCIDYGGLADAMFHLIRQNAAGSAAVLIRMIDVLIAVAGCERHPARLAVLQRHADLIRGDGEKTVRTPSDLEDLIRRHGRFALVRQHGALAGIAS